MRIEADGDLHIALAAATGDKPELSSVKYGQSRRGVQLSNTDETELALQRQRAARVDSWLNESQKEKAPGNFHLPALIL